ncbi:uncharacterized protein LOC126908776 isoform X45 [Daktulosphaira vitifoliae]|uniref:uncharacterized protein LOC126908776 isoform X42 n=1 Tax=Daktulosphaira vitifoliae TaxID=58002 RepID=UPI0021AA01B1|nr:uncharacterized protein LOC126908776 isoform X42 [Daktulosphaira vitifoliae]XP_050547296.1 uncharacterized protein LOC126908776 isoform X43 [Daktulosphaira vitifoliae]XP_050547304.1 uncharacterized protein LOC126908776 isoform X44 [Daktulosphaira vitifoliae]XP_050547310.1 uncharacterized protein LOC126908776 isoform X45 [Daktulosphaira vitifoliae]
MKLYILSILFFLVFTSFYLEVVGGGDSTSNDGASTSNDDRYSVNTSAEGANIRPFVASGGMRLNVNTSEEGGRFGSNTSTGGGRFGVNTTTGVGRFNANNLTGDLDSTDSENEIVQMILNDLPSKVQACPLLLDPGSKYLDPTTKYPILIY